MRWECRLYLKNGNIFIISINMYDVIDLLTIFLTFYCNYFKPDVKKILKNIALTFYVFI